MKLSVAILLALACLVSAETEEAENHVENDGDLKLIVRAHEFQALIKDEMICLQQYIQKNENLQVFFY